MNHALAAGGYPTGWVVGYTIGIVVVLVVVALVVPILLLARSIGNEAPKINDALTQAVHNTAPLGALRTTIDYAVTIIGGTLTAAKANTASTVLIPQVADGVEAVLAEGLQHHLFLGRVLGKVKS